jgi:hypothetical protein
LLFRKSEAVADEKRKAKLSGIPCFVRFIRICAAQRNVERRGWNETQKERNHPRQGKRDVPPRGVEPGSPANTEPRFQVKGGYTSRCTTKEVNEKHLQVKLTILLPQVVL